MTKSDLKILFMVTERLGTALMWSAVSPAVSTVNSIGISLDDSDHFLSILLLTPVISAQLPSSFVEGSKIRACPSLS